MAAFTDTVKDAVMQIFQTVTFHMSTNKELYFPGFIPEGISGAISVADPIVSFFWDFTRKGGLFGFRI